MAQIGTVEVQTQNNGVVQIPIFETGDSGSNVYEFVRVQTPSGVGFIPLVDPADASFPYIRVQSENNGVVAVHNEAQLINYLDLVYIGEDGVTTFRAFSRDGTEVWSTSLDNLPTKSEVNYNGEVLPSHLNESTDTSIYQLSGSDGSQTAKNTISQTGSSNGTQAIDGQRVLIAYSTSGPVRFELWNWSTDTQVWSFDDGSSSGSGIGDVTGNTGLSRAYQSYSNGFGGSFNYFMRIAALDGSAEDTFSVNRTYGNGLVTTTNRIYGATSGVYAYNQPSALDGSGNLSLQWSDTTASYSALCVEHGTENVFVASDDRYRKLDSSGSVLYDQLGTPWATVHDCFHNPRLNEFVVVTEGGAYYISDSQAQINTNFSWGFNPIPRTPSCYPPPDAFTSP